jgi:hypothetical protein
MRKFNYFLALPALLIGCVLSSCHSDVDLNNIDPKAELDLGIALPVGSIHATIADFLGDGIGKIYVDSLDNKGVLTWKDTFQIARNFHKVDLTKNISSTTLNLNVYDQAQAKGLIGPDGKITGMGIQTQLDFPLTLKLKGINQPDAAGNLDERLDSAYIDLASFASEIKTKNGLPLAWEWIDEVTLDLGNQIDRPAGNTMLVYDKNRDNYGYGQTIPTEVDKFTIHLMKFRDMLPSSTNIIDSCQFMVHFKFTVPAGTQVVVPAGSGFEYKLTVQFIDYRAIWGYFKPSSDMSDEALVDLSESWGELDFISRSNVPFADPRIDMHVVTHVAGAMKMDGDYLFAEDKNGVKHYAEFTRGANVYQNFPKQFEEGEYLDPVKSTIGDSTTNMIIFFSKDPKEGHIDKLFQNMPQKLGYKFRVDFNYTLTPQIRVTDNTSIRIDAICRLPFIFNQGLYINYKDTMDSVNLSQFKIDSLLTNAEIKDADVKVVLHAKNTIPLDIKAAMRCLDEYGNVIADPADPSKPLLLFKQDTITLKAPKYVQENGSWAQKEPGETIIYASLTKAEMDLLPSIRKIEYDATIDDESLAEAYKNDMSNIRITKDQGLTLKIGLAAKVDAVFDPDNKNNQ